MTDSQFTQTGNRPPRGLGALRDQADTRDHAFVPFASAAAPVVQAALPESKSIVSAMPDVYDQGQLGSCTANAVGSLFEHSRKFQHLDRWTPSRLQIYRNARILLDPSYAGEDSGATIRTAIKATVGGVCPERLWPYVDDGKTFALTPSTECVELATHYEASEYLRIGKDDNPDDAPRSHTDMDALSYAIRASIVEGYPVAFAILLYETFQPGPDGRVPAPIVGRDKEWGGHAMTIVGYRNHGEEFLIRNSWGRDWGGIHHGPTTVSYRGHVYVSGRWLLGSGQDFWTIRKLSG